MALKFHLYNDLMGPQIVQVDPIGINELTQIVKRSQEFEGVVFEIILDVEFIKYARHYLKACYESSGGIDAIVHVVIYDLNPNNYRWEHYATGKINFNKYELSEESVIVNIENSGIAHRITNLMETDVDLEGLLSKDGNLLPFPVLHDVKYHSKTITKSSELKPSGDDVDQVVPDAVSFSLPTNSVEVRLGQVLYVPIDTSNVKLNELDETVGQETTMLLFPDQPPLSDVLAPDSTATTDQYKTFLSTENRKKRRAPNYRALEAGRMNVFINIRARVSGYAYGTETAVTVDGQDGRRMGRMEVIAWFEHRDVNDTIYSGGLVELGRWTLGDEVDNFRRSEYETKFFEKRNLTVAIGDKFYGYLTYRVYGKFDVRTVIFGSGGTVHNDLYVQYRTADTYIKFQSGTFADTSNHGTNLLYEAVKRCCQYYTNVDDCFYSELLGRTDLIDSKGQQIYAADGEAGLIGITSGNKLRSNGKHIITNLKDLLEFIHARFCIGFGFEIVNGRQVFRVEKIEHFYKKSQRILSLGKVYNIKKSVNPALFYKQVEYGYSGKLDIGQMNAIDEFNTIRRADIPVANAKNKLIITTKLRASGNQIEYQRRLAGTTIDSKLDDEVFVVCVIRDGIGNYKTQSIEGFDLAAFGHTVAFPETQYNFYITPGRMLRRHVSVLGANVIRATSKTIRFSYGEVNYELTSRREGEDVIKENGNLDLSATEPVYDNEEYTFSFRLARNQMKILKANPYGYIEFEDTFGIKHEGFLTPDGIEHDPNKKTAEFTLRRVHRGALPIGEVFVEPALIIETDGVVNPLAGMPIVKGMTPVEHPSKLWQSILSNIQLGG